MPNITDYTNYRAFLGDQMAERSKSDATFSFRKMSRRIGFASPNYLQRVIEGKRNLTSESAALMAKALCSGKRERRYFETMVAFNQAKDAEEKTRLFGVLSALRKSSPIAKIQSDQYAYYDQWYTCVIRELVTGVPVDLDYKELAGRVDPPILPKQAKKAVGLLLDLGMIKVDDGGRYAQTSPFVATDREVQSLAVRSYHKEMSNLARKAIDRVPLDKREISSLTLRISAAGFERLKKQIQEFKEGLMKAAGDDRDVDRVYQINFQMFPISKINRKVP
jgi:uncharacterized protein (TIGR02147 family)